MAALRTGVAVRAPTRRRARSARIGSLLLAALALLSSGRVARAQEADPWWGRDKALHFGVSASLAAGGYAVSSTVLDERWQRASAGAGFALTLGVGKELYDATGHGSASGKDLAWDAAGTAVGVALALLVDVLITGSSARPEAANR